MKTFLHVAPLIAMLAMAGCKPGVSNTTQSTSTPPADTQTGGNNTPPAGTTGSFVSVPYDGQFVACRNHDGRVYETAHFRVFANKPASEADASKIKVAELAEQHYDALKTLFEVSDGDINDATNLTVAVADKIPVCEDFNSPGGSNSGSASIYGIYIQSIESPETVPAKYARLLKHEMTHFFQARLLSDTGYIVDRWFSEGLATAAADQEVIHEMVSYNAWITDGLPNPISIHSIADVPASPQTGAAPDDGDYYRMYSLAVRYLLMSSGNEGAGNRYADVARLYKSIRAKALAGYSITNADFVEAFDSTMRDHDEPLTLASYEAEFFNTIHDFLGKRNHALSTAYGDLPIYTVYVVPRGMSPSDPETRGLDFMVDRGVFDFNTTFMADGDYDAYLYTYVAGYPDSGYGPFPTTLTRSPSNRVGRFSTFNFNATGLTPTVIPVAD